ncbi:hypothetical protein Tco_0932735 [Tanacetum coccineum]
MAPKKRTTRASPATTTTTTPVTNAQLKALIDQGIADALAAHDADRSMNGDDSHNSGTGVRRNERATRECTYPDFMKCQPLNFKGTEGVVELTQWFEKMETVFRISNCSVENQIKFSTCTLLGSALTWWNSHVRTVGHDVAYAMTWTDLKKKMTDKYCPRSEIKKLEVEMYIIANGNYKPTIKDKDGKDVVTPYEKLDENQKKMLSENDEAKMVLYNALPKEEYERIFMCDSGLQNILGFLLKTTHQDFNSILLLLKALDEIFFKVVNHVGNS